MAPTTTSTVPMARRLSRLRWPLRLLRISPIPLSDSTWVSTNEAGDLTGFWGYDAFGTLDQGTPTSSFGYRQYTDPTSGFSVLRAQDYDPATGSFFTRDPAFETTDTAYTYAGGDPVNGGDPSGLCSAGGTYLVPGPCDWTSHKWVSWAEDDIHAQYAPSGFSPIRGLEGVSDFFASSANALVSGVTLGNVHISDPFPCLGGWINDVGDAYAFVVLGLLGVEEVDAPASLEAVDEAEGIRAPADLVGTSNVPELALPETVNNAASPIRSFVTSEDMTFYRVFSDDKDVGAFLTGASPESADAAVEGLALPPGNTADFIQEVRVPAGTQLQSSIAAEAYGQPGGLLQFELLEDIPTKNFGPGVPFR